MADSVGIVGGGQLARMLCEAASAIGISTVVLAEREDDAATSVASHVLLGSPKDSEALYELADRSSVVTFDHELVDLDVIAKLESGDVSVRPRRDALVLAVDKALMRSTLVAAGVAVPAHVIVDEAELRRLAESAGMAAQLETIGHQLGWPLIVKTARGGYDGKGVWSVSSPDEGVALCATLSSSGAQVPLIFEKRVAIDAELAVLVATAPDGRSVTWPVAKTVQRDGVCREVLVPAPLDAEIAATARSVATKVAQLARSEGVLAVEMFWTGQQLLVNELATRPHNSGHWTMEGAETSQFENHLRAVLGLPLGSTDLITPCVATVNVFGDTKSTQPTDRLAEALAEPTTHVHLYGKISRPRRKLGHVTVRGADLNAVREKAWRAAMALGSPPPEPGAATIG